MMINLNVFKLISNNNNKLIIGGNNLFNEISDTASSVIKSFVVIY